MQQGASRSRKTLRWPGPSQGEGGGFSPQEVGGKIASLVALWLLGCGAWGATQPGYAVEVGPSGLVLREGGGRVLLQGLRYQARDEQGLVFQSRGATEGEQGQVTFALDGPGASEAALTARLTRLQRGIALDWTLRYSGPERPWNPWTSGFSFDFPQEITGAHAEALLRWVQPTGVHPWEVAGDTPYPDTEGQLRAVLFGDTALAMVWSQYDGDWIYGNDRERVRFARWPPAAGERTLRMALLIVPTAEVDPAPLAAEAAGRPLALTVRTPRRGNLFAPGEEATVEYCVHNVAGREQAGTLSLEAWSYQGQRLLAEIQEVNLPGQGRLTFTRRLKPQQRGVVFLATRLAWPDGETIHRTTLGILPERRAEGIRPESPFGLAAVIANPQAYPDQFDLATVLPLVERIGARWVRGGWVPFQAEITDEEEARTRERLELLHRHGLLPHVQWGSSVPKPEEQEEFQQRLRASLQRFRGAMPGLEIGNELNYSSRAAEYVERMLRPIHQAMRQVCPEVKILSMGLGGVGPDWLEEFVAAGGMDLIDVLSIHPGSFPRAPEFWEGWRGWVFRPQVLDALKAAREHGNRQVWITEAYAPTVPDRSGLDLRTSADYLVRTYVCALALGVRVIEWYQFQDGVWFARRPCPQDVEYNFGLVYTDLTPKPAYVAYGAMTEQLEGATCQGRLDLGAEDLYGVRFQRGGETVDVLWSYREKHETDLPWWPPENYAQASRKPGEPWEERWKEPVTVELPADGPITMTDLMGNARQISPENGKIRLALTGSPVYVRGLGALPWRAQMWEEI